jgi:hypothetical protein
MYVRHGAVASIPRKKKARSNEDSVSEGVTESLVLHESYKQVTLRAVIELHDLGALAL